MTTKESMLWGLDQNRNAEGSHKGKTVRGTERIMELKLLLECEREVVGGENSDALQTWVIEQSRGPAPSVSCEVRELLISWLL